MKSELSSHQTFPNAGVASSNPKFRKKIYFFQQTGRVMRASRKQEPQYFFQESQDFFERSAICFVSPNSSEHQELLPRPAIYSFNRRKDLMPCRNRKILLIASAPGRPAQPIGTRWSATIKSDFAAIAI
jgi:hypothetical protein